MSNDLIQSESFEVLESTSSAEELRGKRVWDLVRVGMYTWLSYAGYYWCREKLLVSSICLVTFTSIWSLLFASRGKTNYHVIMNISLVFCGIGIFAVSVVEQSTRLVMFFFPVGIFIASFLSGRKATRQWFLITLTAIAAHYCFVYWGQNIFASKNFDEIVLLYGVAVCIYFCCQQAEASHAESTRSLVEFSGKLKTKAEHLHQLATTDSLTGLLNRFQFQTELEEYASQAVAGGDSLALLMIDLDGFKEINDTLGHPVGDKALVAVSEILKKAFGEDCRISRLGGDEFCVICPGFEYEEAAAIAEHTRDLLTQHYVLKDCEFYLGASVGFALCPSHATTFTELLSCADTAMYQAKQEGLGAVAYKKSMTDRLTEYRSTQEKLAVALEKEEFFLVYQPQLDRRGRIVGVEALLRWRHGDSVIGPSSFVPLLEQSREIIFVGRWIVRECCRQWREWKDRGIDLEVSLNLSAVQFSDDELIPYLEDSIEEFRVNPTKLDFEITESLLVDDLELGLHRLEQLKSIGASISIDDFGTGYSSLAYLQQFPIDRLKIDRTFIKDIPENDDGVIACSIVALAKALSLKVLAEGVETQEQLNFLNSLDCDEYQGFFFSKPVLSEVVEELLEANHSDAVSV